jgi:DNA-binding MurR/RpiR family transcriptional regulator
MNDVGQDGGGQGAFEHEFKARVTFAGGGLTANDVRVAQYLQEHLGDLPFLAADEVADSVGVSRAAVVRLARRLGYPSFAAMRDESRRQFRGLRRSPLSRFARSAAGSGPLPECGARKFEEDVANLQATWTMVAERLGPAAKDLALAPRAFITGSVIQNSM